MAKIEPLAKFILSFEGGFVNDPKDRVGRFHYLQSRQGEEDRHLHIAHVEGVVSVLPLHLLTYHVGYQLQLFRRAEVPVAWKM